ncbi:CinA family protein [Sediminibacterium roseum]|uniref:CinA family protein n=1 Tax=Sediminibacterium roseum TaxID=1978412 RepID=A0ABW9ZSH0_9BACT|nr:CinA family protein [Sediminibacterium roseum]NCI49387.1 CinA family protein [Sediminibacterium roseum]
MFNKELVDAVRDKMIARKETLAVAESVTSGYLQAAISNAKDAKDFFQGGITAYNLGQKYRHLLVDPIHAQACNCVSEQVAESMALHVCELFKSDWGVGVCGYAAAGKESGGEMYAYFAISYDNKIINSGRVESTKKEGEETQIYFTEILLQQLYAYLLQNPD